MWHRGCLLLGKSKCCPKLFIGELPCVFYRRILQTRKGYAFLRLSCRLSRRRKTGKIRRGDNQEVALHKAVEFFGSCASYVPCCLHHVRTEAVQFSLSGFSPVIMHEYSHIPVRRLYGTVRGRVALLGVLSWLCERTSLLTAWFGGAQDTVRHGVMTL